MISSGAGNVATPYNTVYAASKFAVEALADGTRIEVASQGVHVSVVNPGTMGCLLRHCHVLACLLCLLLPSIPFFVYSCACKCLLWRH